MSDETLQGVAHVLAEVFKVPAASVTRDTQAVDVQGWDSLAHARVIMLVERAFGIRLPTKQAFVVEDVGGLCALVAQVRGRP